MLDGGISALLLQQAAAVIASRSEKATLPFVIWP
jgi:hypothetical protein